MKSLGRVDEDDTRKDRHGPCLKVLLFGDVFEGEHGYGGWADRGAVESPKNPGATCPCLLLCVRVEKPRMFYNCYSVVGTSDAGA